MSAKQAESNYLKQWDKNGPKAADANKPVTNVSWFAAHAYCAAQGKRLPTNDEWEFVGLASELQANGSNEPSYNRTILSWYENGSKGLKNIRQNKPNFYGVYDMHGLIWEWTSDFNSSQITSGTLKAADFLRFRRSKQQRSQQLRRLPALWHPHQLTTQFLSCTIWGFAAPNSFQAA